MVIKRMIKGKLRKRSNVPFAAQDDDWHYKLLKAIIKPQFANPKIGPPYTRTWTKKNRNVNNKMNDNSTFRELLFCKFDKAISHSLQILHSVDIIHVHMNTEMSR